MLRAADAVGGRDLADDRLGGGLVELPGQELLAEGELELRLLEQRRMPRSPAFS
jgi:hypothetical protein